jgi:1-acyl-sn-glycerol-3-phosphate acyltransferase
MALSWAVLPVIRFRFRLDPTKGSRRCRSLLNRCLRLHAGYMQLLGLIKFDPRGVERQLPGGAFVLVANHPSLIDVVLILATCPTMYCVVKGAVMRSPFVGRMLRYGNHIDAGDGDALAGLGVVQGALERLRAGDPVLIFPEGTRSPRNGLGQFHRGAFAIAKAAEVPVVPLHISCHPPSLLRGMKWYTVPDSVITYEFEVMPPLSADAFGGNAKIMAGEVRSAIAAYFPDPRPT